LAPGVATPGIEAMLAAARKAGAYGGKVCGAGGGGCVFCIGEPDRIPAIREAVRTSGGQLLDFSIETDGLRVEQIG
jgi:D-glycero-alpha-D-manno-heptose-7-phosphate kinase